MTNKLAQKTQLDEIMERNSKGFPSELAQQTLPLYDPQWQERKTNNKPWQVAKPEEQIDLDQWSAKREFAPPPRKPINMNYPPLSPDQIGTRRLNEKELKRLQNERDSEHERAQHHYDRYGYGDYRKKQEDQEIARLDKYKELDNTLPEEIKKQILEKYNQFRKVAAEFYEKYKEANEIASTANELSYDGAYKDLVRNFAQYVVDMVKVRIGELFGSGYNSARSKRSGEIYNAGNLAEFFRRGLNLFSIHAFNFEAKLNEMSSVIHHMKSIMTEYERKKKVLQLLPKKVNASVESFLRKKENRELLKWLDEYFPDSKKEFVKDSLNGLVDTSPYNSQNNREQLYLEDLKNFKVFKAIYDKAIGTSTEKLLGNINKRVSSEIVDEVYKHIESKVKPKLKYLQLLIEPGSDISFPELARTLKKEYQIDLPSIFNFVNTIIDNYWGKRKAFGPEEIAEKIETAKSLFYSSFIENLNQNIAEYGGSYKFREIVGSHLNGFLKNWNRSSGIMFHNLKKLPELSEKDLNNLVSKIFKEIVVNSLPNFKSPNWSQRRDNLDIPDFSSLGEMVKETGRFSISDFANYVYAMAPSVPKEFWFNLIKQSVKGATQLGMGSIEDFKHFSYMKDSEHQVGLEALVNLLKKQGKFNTDNFVNMFRSYYDKFHGIAKKLIVEYNKLSQAEQANIISNAIRNIDTIEQDIDNLRYFLDFKHNEAADLDDKATIKIMHNQNFQTFTKNGIARKLIKIYSAIQSRGGANAIYKKYGDLIKDLIKRRFINRSFRSNMKFIVDFFNSNQEVNPKSELFNKLFETISSLETDLTTIEMGDTLKELSSSYQEKDKKLFNLNLKINDRLRFRVLDGKDPRALRVGVETSCCQRIGGVGETVARDSFINPLAGILLLEWKNDEGKWELLSQSYFHYVPKDNAYILDNVEKNGSNVRDSEVDLEAAYALLAKIIKDKYDVSYFLAGKGYSKIDTSDFSSYKLRTDPRFFRSESTRGSGRSSVYSDFEARNSIDLLNPKGKDMQNRISTLTSENKEKLAFRMNMRKIILQAMLAA